MTSAERPARRILACVSDRIGDVIFCTPALRLLRESLPGARIDVMAQSPAAAEVLRGNPCVDGIFLHEEAARVAATTRYDVLVDFKRNKVTRAAAPLFGFEEQASPRRGDEHEAEVALACVERAIGVRRGSAPRPYELHPDAGDVARAAALLAEARVREGDVLVGLHLGCNRVARRGWKLWKSPTHPKAWPVARFVALARALQGALPRLRFVLTGSAGELVLGRRLLAASPDAVNLIGRTSVLELAAVMRHLRLFVTSDTGPLHVACASGIPLVCLFGATPRAWFGPWPPRSDRVVLEGDPVASIPVSAVRDAVLAQLADAGVPRLERAAAARA